MNLFMKKGLIRVTLKSNLKNLSRWATVGFLIFSSSSFGGNCLSYNSHVEL